MIPNHQTQQHNDRRTDAPPVNCKSARLPLALVTDRDNNGVKQRVAIYRCDTCKYEMVVPVS